MNYYAVVTLIYGGYTEKLSVFFQKMKNSLLEENLKYLKKLNISSQPHTLDFN